MEESEMSSRTHDYLEKALIKYVSKEVFCDITLISDDLLQFPAHKVVLGAHSPVLETLLLSLKQNNDNTVLHLRGYTGTSIQRMLNFMYSGKDLAKYDKNFTNLATDLKITGVVNDVETDSINIQPTNFQENLDEISSKYLILKQASISLDLVKEKSEEKKIGRAKSEENSISLNLIKENSEEKKLPSNKNTEGTETILSNAGYDVVDVDEMGEKPVLSQLSYFKIIDDVPNIFECVFCEEVEMRKASLNHHVRRFHSEIKAYKCKSCDKKFKSVKMLEYHFHANHRPHPYQCIKCDYTNGMKHNVRSHYIFHHLPKYHNKIYLCKKCSYTTHMHSTMKSHVQIMHGGGQEKFKCEQCDALLTGKASLYGHIQQKHKKERFQCSRCPYKAPSRSYLKIHEEGIHEGILRECAECEFKSKTPFGLKKHIDVNHRGIRYNCDQCSKVFRDKGQLKVHELRKHNAPHSFRERITEN